MSPNIPKGILVVIELLSLTFIIDIALFREPDRNVDGIIESFDEEAHALQRPKYLEVYNLYLNSFKFSKRLTAFSEMRN